MAELFDKLRITREDFHAIEQHVKKINFVCYPGNITHILTFTCENGNSMHQYLLENSSPNAMLFAISIMEMIVYSNYAKLIECYKQAMERECTSLIDVCVAKIVKHIADSNNPIAFPSKNIHLFADFFELYTMPSKRDHFDKMIATFVRDAVRSMNLQTFVHLSTNIRSTTLTCEPDLIVNTIITELDARSLSTICLDSDQLFAEFIDKLILQWHNITESNLFRHNSLASLFSPMVRFFIIKQRFNPKLFTFTFCCNAEFAMAVSNYYATRENEEKLMRKFLIEQSRKRELSDEIFARLIRMIAPR